MTKTTKKSSLDEPLTRNNAAEIITKAVTNIVKDLVTKDDIKNMATKADIRLMPTKEDIKYMATKSDIKDMATKEDIKGMATKADLADMETRFKQHVGEEIGTVSSDILTSIDEVVSPMQQSLNRIEKSQERLIQALNSQY